MAKIFPNLRKGTDIQDQKAPRVPNKLNPERPTPGHTVIKMATIKDKETILKAARGKQVPYEENPIRLSANLQVRKEWWHILKVLKERNLQPRIIAPARLSIIHHRRRNSVPDKQELREFITIQSAL